MTDQPKCELCGEPMPEGEEMFKYHGYSGPCPKPPLPNTQDKTIEIKIAEIIWRRLPAQADGVELAQQITEEILKIYPPTPSSQAREK